MHKKILTAIATMGVLLSFAANVYAGNVSARIEQPKSPTNQTDLHINYVALDILGRPVTVRCFKKGPSDGAFAQFSSDIALASGGNSGNCDTSSSILSSNGTYSFFITAIAGGDSVDSATVTVDYNTSGPGTPTNYGKEKIDSCTYKIHLRSADDTGKTVKVEIYRSDSTSFNLDNGTRVGTVTIGSSTDADFNNTVPDCNKTYFYAIRAFDSAGNGSGVVGDSVTVTTTIPGPATTAAPAIPVTTAIPASGQVLGTGAGPTGATGTAGEEEVAPTPAPTEEVLGAETPQPGLMEKLLTGQNLAIGVGVATVIGLLAWLLKKRNQSV